MKALALSLPLLVAALAPLAPTAAATCVETGSQWAVCYEAWCVVVEGPALHVERCVPVGALVGDFCVNTGSQWRACVAYPCVILDGPALHEEFCLERVSA